LGAKAKSIGRGPKGKAVGGQLRKEELGDTVGGGEWKVHRWLFPGSHRESNGARNGHRKKL